MRTANGVSPESRQRARGERKRLLLAMAAVVVAGPFLFGSLDAARESIEPYVDSLRTTWAVLADLLLVAAAALLAVAALALEPLDRWRRMVTRLRGGPYALAALLVALPLVETATKSVYDSQTGLGGPAPGLMLGGALGLGIGMLALLARRVPTELAAASLLPTTLLVIAVVRDIS